MKKKGQYLIIDAFIAFSILSVGMLLVLEHSKANPATEVLELVAEDLAASILEIEVRSLNDPVIKDQIRQGYITNTENSLLQQAYELKLYVRSDPVTADFINASIAKLVPAQLSVEILVDGRTIYSKGYDQREARNLVSIKKVVFGTYNDEEIWGPLKAEVRMWD